MTVDDLLRADFSKVPQKKKTGADQMTWQNDDEASFPDLDATALEKFTRIATCLVSLITSNKWTQALAMRQVCAYFALAIPRFGFLLAQYFLSLLNSPSYANETEKGLKNWIILSLVTMGNNTVEKPNSLQHIPPVCKQIVFSHIRKRPGMATVEWLVEMQTTKPQKFDLRSNERICKNIAAVLKKAGVVATLVPPAKDLFSDEHRGYALWVKFATNRTATHISDAPHSARTDKLKSNERKWNVLAILFSELGPTCFYWKFVPWLRDDFEKTLTLNTSLAFTELNALITSQLEKEKVEVLDKAIMETQVCARDQVKTIILDDCEWCQDLCSEWMGKIHKYRKPKRLQNKNP